MVRHPDMPSAAFANLCATLKRGQPWMGIVKNRCKNGDFYWVDGDPVVGGGSVRVTPEPETVVRAGARYRKLWIRGGLNLPDVGLSTMIDRLRNTTRRIGDLVSQQAADLDALIRRFSH